MVQLFILEKFYLVHFDPFNLSIFPHLLNIDVIIIIITMIHALLFLITTFVLRRENISNDEQQRHAAYITDSDDYPRDVVPEKFFFLIDISIQFNSIQFFFVPENSGAFRKKKSYETHRGLYFACHINGATEFPIQYAESMMALVVIRLVWPAVTVDNQDNAKTNPVVPTPF